MSAAKEEPGNISRPSADRLVRDLSDMVAIASVNPFDAPASPGHREQEFADYFQGRLDELGLETGRRDVVDGRPNVWGRLKGRGSGPSLMLAGHMDTVGVEGYDNPFKPVVKDGRVYGRGSCDMKAALACYLEVVRCLQESGTELEGDLLIAGVCDEEHVMIGSSEFGRNGPTADFGIVGEPSELKLCPAHKGQLGVLFRTRGKAVHSSVPEKGVNAIEHMGEVIHGFSTYNDELQKAADPHPLCGTGRFSMNVIRGGDIVSAIADVCEMEVDRRYLPGETIEQIVADYRTRLDALSKKIPDFTYEISEPTLDVKPLDTPVDSALVASVKAAADEALGHPVEIAAFPGGTDAPNLAIPCVILGPGSLEQAHSLNEFVAIDQMVDATSIYLGAARRLCNRA